MIEQQEIEQQQPLIEKSESQLVSSNKKTTLKKLYASIAIVNGILYFSVSRAGGDNVERIFLFHGTWADVTMDAISVGSSLCYTMFFYKTLESLSILPKNFVEIGLTILAPFAASSFLTAGIEGTKALGLLPELAIIIGCILFVLRIVNCVDGSTKFPSRLREMKTEWNYAWAKGDYKELLRLIVTAAVSLGFSVASTDAIYNASMTLLRLFSHTQESLFSYISYGASILGAIGTLPMTLYWTHRGLKQLTFGGRTKEDGTNPDPTDRYSFFSLPIVSTVTLGIIGSATGTNGHVFGKLGLFANTVRVASSTIYAVAAATPGISTLLRGIFKKAPPLPRMSLNVDSKEQQKLEEAPFEFKA